MHDRRLVEPAQELGHEPGFPDARGAEDGEEVARALADDVLERVAQQLEVPPATDHLDAEAARGRCSVDAEQAICSDGVGLPFELERVERDDRDGVAQQLQRVAADQDLTGLGSLLEARGDVDRVAGCEPLLGAGDDLACHRADSPLQAELRQRLAHLGRRT